MNSIINLHKQIIFESVTHHGYWFGEIYETLRNIVPALLDVVAWVELSIDEEVRGGPNAILLPYSHAAG